MAALLSSDSILPVPVPGVGGTTADDGRIAQKARNIDIAWGWAVVTNAWTSPTWVLALAFCVPTQGLVESNAVVTREYSSHAYTSENVNYTSITRAEQVHDILITPLK